MLLGPISLPRWGRVGVGVQPKLIQRESSAKQRKNLARHPLIHSHVRTWSGAGPLWLPHFRHYTARTPLEDKVSKSRL